MANDNAFKNRTSFLSYLSHEIRTPINAILGLNEMILRESKEEGTLRYAYDIQSAGKSLLSLVNDILDFSKIESGKLEIVPVEYDLSSVVNDLVNMVKVQIEDKGPPPFDIHIDQGMPHLLMGDEIRIKQCVLNILTNAIKYTQKGTVALTISSTKLDDEHITLNIHVSDTESGSEQKSFPSFYEKFQQMEEDDGDACNGLGISIVQQLLELMDSKLEVAGESGVCSDYSFKIPQKVVSWEPIGNYSDAYKQTVKETKRYVESFHAPDAHILIVDDTALNLTVACSLLKQTKINIDTAESGKRTLEMATQKKYDIMFIDHRMPVMDGVETLHELQKLDGNLNKDTPCIALTANAVSGSRELYLQEGFTDYLSKPVDGKKFERMIMEYLPPEKVQVVIDDTPQETEEEPDVPELSQVSGISLEKGIKNCGGKQALLKVIREFYEAIDPKSAQMDLYATSGDIKNLTILTHALKSSARLIGASELSEKAALLERLGNENNTEEIAKNIKPLLELYRSYKQHLVNAQPKHSENRRKLSVDEYTAALQNIKECVKAFDFTTADSVISLLEECEVPKEEEERYKLIKQAIASVDYDAVLKLL